MSPYHNYYPSDHGQLSPEEYQYARQWARYFLYQRGGENIEEVMTDLGALCYLLGKGYQQQDAYEIIDEWKRYEQQSSKFRIVGYYPYWTSISLADSIQFDKVTHIMWSFILPTADGTIKPLENTTKLRELLTTAKRYGVKVYVSVGGYSDGDVVLASVFEEAMSKADSANRLVDSIMQVVYDYDFDGVDVDWEFPKAGTPSQQGYQDLMIMLRKRLKPINKGLSTAVIGGVNPFNGVPYTETVNGYTDRALQQADFINIMSYDGGDGPEHSSIDFANYALDYWMTRVPKNKLTLGIPAYARPSMTTYRAIIKMDPDNAYRNHVTINGVENYYNDIPEVQTKTKIAIQRANGVLFWELSGDTMDYTSLVGAAYGVAKQSGKI
ncbi:MAG: glycosyl hydrolase family 18 protein [Bacillaceae bacterium]